MRFSVENEKILDSVTGLMVVELFDSDIGAYEYYLYMPGFTFVHAFGCPDHDRFSTDDLMLLHNRGYFDEIIRTEFI